MPDDLLDDLLDWLRIPSISTGGGDPADLRRAAEWVCERVEGAGGTAALLESRGNPIAYGQLRASRDGAPTVLIYGHYDVQGPGDESAWLSPPFQPEIRDGRIYARGASDDKGNFFGLLHAACALARSGELPVNVRVVAEGEEEAGSAAVLRWIRGDDGPADAAIVMDSGMADERTPAVTVGLRGLVMADVTVRTGRRDLHSGLYGGSVLNAIHVLHAMLAEVVPGPEGRPRPELREGVLAPTEAERDSWRRLKPGDELLAEAGARPVHSGAGREFYERSGADASVDVNLFSSGEPRTLVPAVARGTVSVRIAPGQDSARIAQTLESLLRGAAPAGADVAISMHRAEPALFPPDLPALRLAGEALGRACGTPAAFVRSGGSIPVVAEFAARGIPTIVTGFALPDDDIHAPNESFRVESLRLGEAASREMLIALGGLGA